MTSLYGQDLFGNSNAPDRRGRLFDKFTYPPFSVLNARDGFWQDRKQRWLSYGIQGEVGRGENLTISSKECTTENLNFYRNREKVKPSIKGGLVQRYHIHNYDGVDGGNVSSSGTSIFDPVLCELMYSWFCPKGGQILDPFAGGSVRGVVAHLLGYKYHGIELRKEQCLANEEQADYICSDNRPTWVCGDSMEFAKESPESDFIFSCPPYGDLEVYSDNPADLSNMEYHTFIAAMRRIVLASCLRLKNNRFACFVVGDFRDEKGFYRNFVSDTIASFKACGLKLYNEAILITAVGSLPIRITRQFEAGRKLGKTHQNVLVFIKGCPKLATSVINSSKEH